jgi:hypothetical protein
MKAVIISRHAATAAWIIKEARLPENTPVISGNAAVADVAGKVVFGNIPLHLAAYAAAVVAVEFSTPPRGSELDAAAMVAAGAQLALYRVIDLPYIDAAGGRIGPNGRYRQHQAEYVAGPIGPAGYRDSND